MKKQRYEGGGGQRRTYVRDSSRLIPEKMIRGRVVSEEAADEVVRLFIFESWTLLVGAISRLMAAWRSMTACRKTVRENQRREILKAAPYKTSLNICCRFWRCPETWLEKLVERSCGKWFQEISFAFSSSSHPPLVRHHVGFLWRWRHSSKS